LAHRDSELRLPPFEDICLLELTNLGETWNLMMHARGEHEIAIRSTPCRFLLPVEEPNITVQFHRTVSPVNTNLQRSHLPERNSGRRLRQSLDCKLQPLTGCPGAQAQARSALSLVPLFRASPRFPSPQQATLSERRRKRHGNGSSWQHLHNSSTGVILFRC